MFQALCWHIVLISKEERYPEHYLCLLTAVLLMLSWFLYLGIQWYLMHWDRQGTWNRYFAPFLFWSLNRREFQIIQESKTFWTFFLITILLMLSSYLWNSISYLMHSKKGEPKLLIRQTTFNLCFSYLAAFSFWPKKWKDSPNILEVKTYFKIFVVDSSITDTKLFFETLLT